MRDNTYGALPTREGHPRLGVQNSYWGSVAEVWLTTRVAEPGLQSFQWSS